MDMQRYNFCGTRSNLCKDMLTAIKELLLIKGVQGIELAGDNASLIREINGMCWGMTWRVTSLVTV